MLLLAFALLCTFWGASWVAIKFSLMGFPPFLGAGLRFLLAMGFLFVYSRLRSFRLTVPRAAIPLLLLTGLMVYFLDYGLIYWAEQYLSAGVTAIFFSTFPLFVGVFANALFRSDPFRLNVYAGLLVSFAGIVVIFGGELTTTRFENVQLLASVAVLVGAASGAAASLLVKTRLAGIDPVSLSYYQMLLGTPGLLLLGTARGEWTEMRWDWAAVLAVVYLGLAASALAFVLYYWLLQRISAVTLSLVVYFTPLVAILFDWLLLGEVPSRETIGGALLILSGVLLSQFHQYRNLIARTR